MSSKPTGRPAADESAEALPSGIERGEATLVAAAIAEGLVLGAWLTFLPAMALRVGGFPAAGAFFVRWAGVLHVVLAIGYTLDWLRFRRTTLLVVAKGTTALFLAATWAIDSLPPLMIIAIVVEGGMALVGATLRRPAERSRRARARLRLVTARPREIRPAGRP